MMQGHIYNSLLLTSEFLSNQVKFSINSKYKWECLTSFKIKKKNKNMTEELW